MILTNPATVGLFPDQDFERSAAERRRRVSHIGLVQLGDLHQRSKQTDLEWPVAVNGNDDSFATAGLYKNMMAAVHAG